MLKVYRDPLYNMITFDRNKDKIIIDLIDTREVQRLKRIRQLGFSWFTFHGAEHSRFAHSIGATHLAKRIIEIMKENKKHAVSPDLIDQMEEYRNLILCSALLHDIGHGPFSHVIERFSAMKHEGWSNKIIMDKTSEVNRVLASYDEKLPEQIRDVITKVFRPQHITKIISSQLDVDRIDYLLRDSLMTGVSYGRFDLEWLLHSLRIGKVSGQTEIGFDLRKGRYIAEEFIIARYSMYNQVYYHKTTRGVEILFEKLIKRLLDVIDNKKIAKKLEFIPSAFVKLIKREELSVEEYLSLDDSVVFFIVNRLAYSDIDTILKDLSQRLLNRRLFKCVEIDDQDFPLTFFLEKMKELNDKAWGKGYDPKYYIGEDTTLTLPYEDSYIGHRSTKKQDDTDEVSEVDKHIFFFDDEFGCEELSRKSDIINAIRNKNYQQRRIYFPAELKEDAEKIFKGER